MNMLINHLLISLLLSLVLFVLAVALGGEVTHSNESISMFECGYESELDSRTPFSLHFFLVIIMFIVFDMEILIVLPMSIISFFSSFSLLSFYVYIVLLFIYLSLIYELSRGCLDWF